MSEYLKKLEELEGSKCLICSGLGECDDAEPGDTSFNKWSCFECRGSGLSIINTYCGHPNGAVTVNGQSLDPQNSIINHSPDGFSYGYGGSGPAQLALAILCHEYGAGYAVENYQKFKFDVIAVLDREREFTLTSDELKTWRENQR